MTPAQRTAMPSRTRPEAGSRRTHRFRGKHARQMLDVLKDTSGLRLHQTDGHVLVLRIHIVDPDHVIDRIQPLIGHHQNGDRKRDAGDGQAGAKRPAHDLTKDDPGRLVQPAGKGRRGRSSFGCRRAGQAAASLLPAAAAAAFLTAPIVPRSPAPRLTAAAITKDVGLGRNREKREAVELGIELGVVPAEPGARDPADHDADRGHRHHHLGIMPADLKAAYSQTL